jgi:hypothetical protein
LLTVTGLPDACHMGAMGVALLSVFVKVAAVVVGSQDGEVPTKRTTCHACMTAMCAC